MTAVADRAHPADVSGGRPAFLFVVDTEGDSEWTHHRKLPPVRNLQAAPRFQALCDRYGIRPTYVVTHSVVEHDDSVAMLREWADAGRAEVGTHLHPWTTPPWEPAYDDAPAFPSELPTPLLRAKLVTLTDAIAERFGRRPTSYRAGRFGFDGRSLQLLEELGYTVDSSITPCMSWRRYPGLPNGPGGPDFMHAPLRPYHPDRDDPTQLGTSPIVEIPLSIALSRRLPARVDSALRVLPDDNPLMRVLGKSRLVRRMWLRPTLASAAEMVDACETMLRHGVPVFNMMIHSSELFPGTSPYFSDQAAIDDLFARMDRAFERIWRRWSPDALTLTAAGDRVLATPSPS